MVETPFTGGAGGGAGGSSEESDTDSGSDSAPELDDNDDSNSSGGGNGGSNTSPADSVFGGPSQGPGLVDDSSDTQDDSNGGDSTTTPDTGNPADAPSASPPDSGGSDDVEAPGPTDPSTAPSATPATPEGGGPSSGPGGDTADSADDTSNQSEPADAEAGESNSTIVGSDMVGGPAIGSSPSTPPSDTNEPEESPRDPEPRDSASSTGADATPQEQAVQDVEASIQSEYGDIERGEDFTVEVEGDTVSAEFTEEGRRTVAARSLDEQFDEPIESGDVRLDGDQAALTEDASREVAIDELAADVGLDEDVLGFDDGEIVPETTVAAEALAEFELKNRRPELEGVETEEVAPGVVTASGENRRGVATLQDEPGVTLATQSGEEFLEQARRQSDARVGLQDVVAEETRAEAGEAARESAAAFEEASEITESVFSGDSDTQTTTASDDADTTSVADPETIDADTSNLSNATPGDVGQRSVSPDIGSTPEGFEESSAPGVTGFLDTFADRSFATTQAVFNPGAADSSILTDPAGDVAQDAAAAAAFQLSPFIAAGDDAVNVTSDGVEAAADVGDETVGALDDATGGAVTDAVDVTGDVAAGGVDAAADAGGAGVDVTGDAAAAADDVVDETVDTLSPATNRAAASGLVYLSPFARAKDPVEDVATDAADASLDVGADAADVGVDAFEDVNRATGGALTPVARAFGTPVANTLILGAEGKRAAENVNEVDERDFETAADSFVENATTENENVTGGPLPVFSVSSPGGLQTFLSGSDDAATASQLASDGSTSGVGATGGSAAGGAGTGTAAAQATDEAVQAATAGTSGAFVDELEIEDGSMFVDEQTVQGNEDVFTAEKPIPDPQELDVGPFGVPELGVRIGADENNLPGEARDELQLPSDGTMFVDEVDVARDQDTPDVPLQAQQLLQKETPFPDEDTNTGTRGGRRTTVPDEFIPDDSVVIGDDSGMTGGGFPSVPSRPGSGLVVGRGSGVGFVGRRPKPETTLPDAESQFFGVDLGGAFDGGAFTEAAGQASVGGDATQPGVAAGSESSSTDSVGDLDSRDDDRDAGEGGFASLGGFDTLDGLSTDLGADTATTSGTSLLDGINGTLSTGSVTDAASTTQDAATATVTDDATSDTTPGTSGDVFDEAGAAVGTEEAADVATDVDAATDALKDAATETASENAAAAANANVTGLGELNQFTFGNTGPGGQDSTPRRPPNLPGPDVGTGTDGDDRSDDDRYSDLFQNPTISPGEALDFDPFDDED